MLDQGTVKSASATSVNHFCQIITLDLSTINDIIK